MREYMNVCICIQGYDMYMYVYIYIYHYIDLEQYCNIYYSIIEESLEAKLPTIWTDGKAQSGRNSDV